LIIDAITPLLRRHYAAITIIDAIDTPLPPITPLRHATLMPMPYADTLMMPLRHIIFIDITPRHYAITITPLILIIDAIISILIYFHYYSLFISLLILLMPLHY
jgi:hypothetical protein